jgi:hypothetical protein
MRDSRARRWMLRTILDRVLEGYTKEPHTLVLLDCLIDHRRLRGPGAVIEGYNDDR